MKDSEDPSGRSAESPELPRGRSIRRGVAATIFGAGLAVGIIVAGLNVAGAQTPTPTETSATAPDGRGHDGQKGGRKGGRHGGPGMGIHGEFVTAAPNGGYQTIATQRGDVTAVSASSITVKSEDGFSRSYVVDEGTMVNAGRDGIADVKNGDKVHVMAIVSGGKATAVQIMNKTNIEKSRRRWKGPREAPPADAPPAEQSSLSSAA